MVKVLLLSVWLVIAGLIPVQAQALSDLLLLDCGFATGAPVDLQVGAVMVNFASGAGCMENADTRFHTASISKVFVAAAYFEAEAQGQFSPDGGMQFTRDYWMGGRTDCLEEEQIGNRYSYRELVDLMITCSDNAATWMLMDALGRDTVAEYIQRLQIDGIGPVLPYSEVDHLKLNFLDERWENVPTALASRFYRSGMTEGLSQYFERIPARPERGDFIAINARYFETYDYNTLTPRALAAFFVKLRDDRIGQDTIAAFVAEQVFSVMLGTQRQYSTQALSGLILAGSKNGFDRGLLAEANLLFSTMPPRIPTGIIIVFAQYVPLTEQNSDFPTSRSSTLRSWMLDKSPEIATRLYPNAQNPRPQSNTLLSSVTVNVPDQINSCWGGYAGSDFAVDQVYPLEQCFLRLPPRITFPVDQNLALGIIMRGTQGTPAYLTIVFTAPDTRRYSYQIIRNTSTSYGLYWVHPIDMAGQWQVDVFVNQQLAATTTFIAQQ